MTESTGRRVRTGYTPVDPSKFVHIDRPSNRSLKGTAFTIFVLWTMAGGTVGACGYLWFINPDATDLYLPAAIVAVIVDIFAYFGTKKEGRRRREDWVRCGGDPTGMSELMFGSMRGERTSEGKWIVPEQGSGDYQGI